MPSDPLASFTPQVADWFARSFEAPTEAQAQAWPALARIVIQRPGPRRPQDMKPVDAIELVIMRPPRSA